MFSKSTWLHLRIPFSFFLMPVFLFALALSPNLNPLRMAIVFVALHFFLYPASNGYNSYFDRDKYSIGGLKNPPEVRKGLYYMSLLFDLIALLLAAFISQLFVGMLLIYGLVSKAYSHPSIRLKKYAWGSWLVAGFFQGCFSYWMIYVGLNKLPLEVVFRPHVMMPALLSSLLLWGSYPMTQVYQHQEDRARGDNTLSLLLGIRGTFLFTAVLFGLAGGDYFFYFQSEFSTKIALVFGLALMPVIGYFFYWMYRVWHQPAKADYTHTMRLNFLSALCLNIFFFWLFLEHSQVAQVLKMGL
jgi:4-hydroxybenzoate polyprenyltransferase